MLHEILQSLLSYSIVNVTQIFLVILHLHVFTSFSP